VRWTRLLRAELRKLATTRMPLAFLVVLVAISAITATAVIVGNDADGSKGFIATAADQQSLMAFAANAMVIAGLFGAIAVAREYAHNTVIPMFLVAPRRHRAVLAQQAAVLIGGALLGLAGAALTVAAVALALPTTDYGFLVSAGGVARVSARSCGTRAARSRAPCSC
jgi:ABC-2 type transport system permease protein